VGRAAQLSQQRFGRVGADVDDPVPRVNVNHPWRNLRASSSDANDHSCQRLEIVVG
jgi:hypothetical protein